MATSIHEVRPLDDQELDQVVGGFQLIELIVRIDVIGVLIALLLPPIQAAHPVHK